MDEQQEKKQMIKLTGPIKNDPVFNAIIGKTKTIPPTIPFTNATIVMHLLIRFLIFKYIKIQDKNNNELIELKYQMLIGYLQFLLQQSQNSLQQENQIMQEENKQKQKSFFGINGEVVGLGFVNRDTGAKNQEDKKVIAFKVIKNDMMRESMKYLLDLKNIFARQLPKMPKEYIVKLVFDRNHQSMIILKDNIKVIGGICFRIFQQERFAEIAFLAITATQQIRGYGTRLMNKLKQQMQARKIEFMMTYADNLALGYFRKQGFSKDCRMSGQRWKGYIKDYEGGTMMECYIHPTIDYSRVGEIIRKQKQIVIEKVKQLSINETVYDGKILQRLVQNIKRTNNDGDVEVFRINPEKIPGVLEAGWSWNDYEELRKVKQISFQIQCSSIIDNIKKHQSIWPFRQPVSPEDVPDYYNVVKRPIDLRTIEKKLLNNQYADKQSFCEDILRMFSNCRLYNQPETVYYKCSMELEEYVKPYLEKLKEGLEEPSLDSQRQSKPTSLKKKVEKIQKKKS